MYVTRTAVDYCPDTCTCFSCGQNDDGSWFLLDSTLLFDSMDSDADDTLDHFEHYCVRKWDLVSDSSCITMWVQQTEELPDDRI